MSKAPTAKDLGIPKGFRLTTTTRRNVLKAASNMKFGPQLLAAGLREADLLNKYADAVFPKATKDKVVSVYTHFVPKEKALRLALDTYTQLPVNSGTEIFWIGSQPFYSNSDTQSCIIADNAFWEYLNDVNDYNRLKIPNPLAKENGYARGIVTDWIQYYCTVEGINQVAIDLCKQDTTFKCIPRPLQKALRLHREQSLKLLEAVTAFRGQLSAVLAQYTSGIKLCTDLPEAIDWICKAENYNAQGKKCTDIPLKDAINQLQKM